MELKDRSHRPRRRGFVSSNLERCLYFVAFPRPLPNRPRIRCTHCANKEKKIKTWIQDLEISSSFLNSENFLLFSLLKYI